MSKDSQKILNDFLQSRPVDLMDLRVAVFEQQKQLTALQQAVHPGLQNQARYAGQVSQLIEMDVITEDGDIIQISKTVKLSWRAIRKVLSLVKQTAHIDNPDNPTENVVA